MVLLCLSREARRTHFIDPVRLTWIMIIDVDLFFSMDAIYFF